MHEPDNRTVEPLDLKPESAGARLVWVDNLRTAMILLVVNIHACITYSFLGSWYYTSPPEPPIASKIPFAFWQGHLQSFFMGLLFFIAGYYADRSLARRSAASFVRERLRRLGIPTLFYMLAIHPFIVIVLHPGSPPPNPPLPYYLGFLISCRFLRSSGPMWFAFALLLFSLIFAAFGAFRRAHAPERLRVAPVAILGLGIGLALATFLTRTVQPIGTSIANFQLCYFPQYVVAFLLGIWISRRDGLTSLAQSRVAVRAGIAGLVLGPLALLGVAVASLPLPEHGPPPYAGGWHLQALAMAIWEQMTGIALGIGAIALFARKLNVRTRWSAWLADRSFAVYLLHPPVLVWLALLAQPVRSKAFVMSMALTIVGLAASYLLADVARRIPLLRTVL